MLIRKMDVTDLHFNNIQLTKLVLSAEKILQCVNEMLPKEYKRFIDDWLWRKQEFDKTCSQNSLYYENKTIPKNSVLTRIDEVTEDEKAASSMSISSIESFNSSEAAEEDSEIELGGETCSLSKADEEASRFNQHLLDRMNEFKLVTNNVISEWHDRIILRPVETEGYLNESKLEQNKCSCERIDVPRMSLNECNEPKEDYSKQNKSDRCFVPISPSPSLSASIVDSLTQFQYCSTNQHPYAENNFSIIDKQIHCLHEIRQILLRVRENQIKLEKKGMTSLINPRDFKRVEVAFEIIDTSIEIKNYLKLGQNIQTIIKRNDEIDNVIADSLCLLSVAEITFLFMMFLNNVVEIRQWGAEWDEKLKRIDNEKCTLRLTIWKLYHQIRNMEKFHQSHKNEYKQLEKNSVQAVQQKLEQIKVTTDESADDNSKNLDCKLTIQEENDLGESSQSSLFSVQESQTLLPKNVKSRSSTSSSPVIIMSQEKKKIVFRGGKNCR